VLKLTFVVRVDHGHANKAQLADATKGVACDRHQWVMGLHRAYLHHSPRRCLGTLQIMDFCEGVGQWLLDEYILALRESGQNDVSVTARGQNEDGVDSGIGEDVAESGTCLNRSGQPICNRDCALPGGVAHVRHREFVA
jgi:hypothetical protein